MCTGNRPDCWLSSILNSLTAGSNFMIPTSMGTRIVMRWGSCPRQTPRQIEAYVLGLRKQPVFVRRMQCPEGVQTRCLDTDDCRRINLRWHNRILCCFFLTFATNVFLRQHQNPTIRLQSVAATSGASAGTEAIAAWSMYGPNRRDRRKAIGLGNHFSEITGIIANTTRTKVGTHRSVRTD
jgi:hypothetical protein